MNKATWLDVAEVLDALRVFPRLILFSAFCFTSWYAWFALSLAVNVVAGASDASVATAIVGGVIGVTVPFVGSMFAKVVDVYLNTGRDWGPKSTTITRTEP